MNNRRQSTSFRNLTISPISTPDEKQTQCGQQSDRASNRYFVPPSTTNRRFTRKNNSSQEKSLSNLMKNTPGRPEKTIDRSVASISSTQKVLNQNNSFVVDSPTPSTVSTVNGNHSNQTFNIIGNSSYVNLNTMFKNQQKNYPISSINLFQRNSSGGGSFRLPKTRQNNLIQSPNLSTTKNAYSRTNLLIDSTQRISEEKCGSRYDSSNSKSFSLESYKNSSSAADSRIRKQKQNSSCDKGRKNLTTIRKNVNNLVQNNNSFSNQNNKYLGNVAILETQLQLKQKQIQKLVFDNEKMSKTLEGLIISEVNMRKQVKEGKKQIKQLQAKVEEERKRYEALQKKMNDQVKKLNKDIQLEKRERGIIKRDKEIAEKQLNSLMDRKIPKNLREIQTYRQISQEKIIQDLKFQISKSKTLIERDMEEMIISLRKQIVSLQQELRSTQIVNRLMSKKSSDSDRYLEAYTAMKNEHKNAKVFIKQLSQECEYLRKENIHVKKQIKKLASLGCYNGKNGKNTHKTSKTDKTTLQVPSDNQSLNLSISVISK